MPFQSRKQRRYMHARHPEIAGKWEKEAKAEGKPAVRKTAGSKRGKGRKGKRGKK